MPGFGLANILSNQKDLGILATAVAMSARIPSEKQYIYPVNLLKRLEQGGELLRVALDHNLKKSSSSFRM